MRTFFRVWKDLSCSWYWIMIMIDYGVEEPKGEKPKAINPKKKKKKIKKKKNNEELDAKWDDFSPGAHRD